MAEARFAFQVSSAPTGNWNYLVSNNMTSTEPETFTAQTLNDIDTGSSTGWTLAGVEQFTVGEVSNGVNAVGSGDAAWVDQAAVSQQAWYAGNTSRGFNFTFAGLDNGETYTIELYSSTTGSSGNVSAFTIGGTTLTLDANSNSSNVARFSNISPSSGEIALTWRMDASATNLAPLNALRIIQDEGGGGANPPSITDVDEDDTVTSTQTDVEIDGADFDTATVEIRQGSTTVAQTVDSQDADTITFDVVFESTADLKYGSATLAVINGDDQEDTISITIAAPTGVNYVDVVTPDTTASNRITAVADIESGDQLEWSNVQGGTIADVTINDDGTFDCDDAVTAFDVRCWDADDSTWGTAATQTIGDDETPDAFSFTDVTDVERSAQQTSDAIFVTGLGDGISVDVTITGGTYSKNGAAYTSSAGTAQNGDNFTVRHTSSSSYSTAVNTVLTIGGVSDTFTSTTRAEDTTPVAFSFTDVTGVAFSTTQTSNEIIVLGLDAGASVAVTVTGGTYSKNGGDYTSDAGTASNGDTFSVRHTSSSSGETTVNTILTIGGVSDTFSSTTLDPVPVFIGPAIGTITVLVDEAMISIDFTERFTHATDDLTYDLTGTLPEGVTFDDETAVLSGTPTETGTFSGLVVTATDEGSDTATSGEFTIRVVEEFASSYLRRPFNFNWWNH